jgi:hypothetical protein
MSECITWVALDTSKKRHVVAVLDPEELQAADA